MGRSLILRERERERERESLIRNNVHNGVVSGAAQCAWLGLFCHIIGLFCHIIGLF